MVAGELLGDGLIDHFLPDLVRVGARVLLLVDELHPDRVLDLVGPRSVRGVHDRLRPGRRRRCGAGRRGRWRMRCPPLLMAAVVTQWRSGWRGGTPGADKELTLREMEVLNAMADGLSTKADRSPARGGRQNGGKPQD